MQWPSWHIGHALGIPIRVHASWFLVFFFVTSTLATGYLPDVLPGLSPQRYWAMGAIAALLLFGSVLLHELGHSFVALRYRIPIDQITLFIFGGVAHMRREAPTPRAELFIAIAGPLVSFALGAACFGLVALAETYQDEHALRGVMMLGLLLGMVNVQLGLFNLIPGYPLDGGRILRAGLWAWGKDFYRATTQASVVGLSFGLALGLLGAAVITASLAGLWPASLAANGGWLVFIGVFLFSAARSSRRHTMARAMLAATPVRDVMVKTVISIPESCSLDEAVLRYFRLYGYGGFPVVADGRLVGLITVDDVHAIPAAQWPWRSVGHVMRPAARSLMVSPETPAIEAMERMLRDGWDRLVVVEAEAIVGLVTQSAIHHAMQLQSRR